MSARNTVSVVITAFNLKDFIGDAINSVLGQTRPPDEIIVIDDCSTDGTAEIIEAFGDRVRLVRSTENQGALRAALTGLSLARGDVVAFLDGDDIWLPKKLELCLNAFNEDTELILVSHQHRRVDRAGVPTGVRDATHLNLDRILRSRHTPDSLSVALKKSVLEKRGYWLGSAYVIRRNSLDLAGFTKWVSTLPRPQDVYLDLTIAPFLILSNPSKRVGFVDQHLFDYRIHGNNSCNDFRDIGRALRSVYRGYYTTLAADDINMRFSEAPFAREAHVEHLKALRYYRFLEAIYTGERLASLSRFISLAVARYFTPRDLMKEAARLTIASIAGVPFLLRLKNRKP